MGVLGGQLAPTRIDLVWHSRTFSPARKSRSALRKKRRISNAISSNIPCVVTVCFVYVFWSCEYSAGSAKPLPPNVQKEFTTGKEEQKRAWNKVSFRYAILSITAKTLLEVGFVWVVSMYKTFPTASEAIIQRGFLNVPPFNQSCFAVLAS
jgi:hypothetical protein